MPTTQCKWALGLVLGVLFATWLVASRLLQAEARRIDLEHHRFADPWRAIAQAEEGEQRKRFQAELKSLQESGERDASERRSRLAAELDAAFGGPVQRVAKSSALNIAGMLRAAALACLPGGSRVTVAADRFTDFTVQMTLHAQVAPSDLAKRLGQFTQAVGPYVQTLRIQLPGAPNIEIERTSLDAINDWNTDGVRLLGGLR